MAPLPYDGSPIAMVDLALLGWTRRDDLSDEWLEFWESPAGDLYAIPVKDDDDDDGCDAAP